MAGTLAKPVLGYIERRHQRPKGEEQFYEWLKTIVSVNQYTSQTCAYLNCKATPTHLAKGSLSSSIRAVCCHHVGYKLVVARIERGRVAA